MPSETTIRITIEIQSDGTPVVSVDNTAGSADHATAAALPKRLQDFVNHNPAGYAQQAYDHMIERGWFVSPSKSAKILHLKYVASGHSAVLYINSASIVSGAQGQEEKALSIPGARKSGKRVKFYYDSLGETGIKDVIDSFTAWVDDGQPSPPH